MTLCEGSEKEVILRILEESAVMGSPIRKVLKKRNTSMGIRKIILTVDAIDICTNSYVWGWDMNIKVDRGLRNLIKRNSRGEYWCNVLRSVGIKLGIIGNMKNRNTDSLTEIKDITIFKTRTYLFGAVLKCTLIAQSCTDSKWWCS